MVLNPETAPILIENDDIGRTNDAQIFTTRVKKSYRVVYNKRQLTGVDYGTLPYGY